MDREYFGYLDYCRALAAVLVVMVHSGLDVMEHAVLFVLPLFFALSGFVYDPDRRTKKEFIRARFLRLVLPFWGLTAMYAPVEAVRSAVLGYGTWKNLLTFPLYMLYGSTILAPATGLTQAASAVAYPYPMAYGRVYITSPSAHHLWFLPALFTGSILFCLLEERTRKGILPKILAVAALLGVAYLDSRLRAVTELPWALGTGSFGAACMLCGRWARQYRLTERSGKVLAVTAAAGAALAVLAECLRSEGDAMISSYYGPHGSFSVWMTFLGGLGGAWTVTVLMRELDALPLERLKRGLTRAGQASMQIYGFHMAFLFAFGCVFLRIAGISPELDGWLLGFIPENAATRVWLAAESIATAALITWLRGLVQGKRETGKRPPA